MRKKTRILYIEDNPADVRLVKEMLSESPGEFELEAVNKLSEGVKSLSTEEYDIVLVDLGLPDSKGLESFKTIFSIAPRIPFVILSGLSDENVAIQAVKGGAQSYLMKDKIDSYSLVNTIQHSIERSKLLMELKETASNLNERVKELNCLHEISKIVEQEADDVEGLIQKIVDTIPPAFLNPENTVVRIKVGDKEFRSSNYKVTDSVLSEPILLSGEEIGVIDIYLLEDAKGKGAQPFQEEERDLLKTISERVGRIVERIRAEDELKKSEEKHRRLFETMAQGVVYQDGKGKIISANPSAEKILGLTLDQMTGRTSIDPRWKSIHEDGSDFPGETHPSMEALKTGKEIKDQIMGVFNPLGEEYRWININAVPVFRPGEKKPHQVYTTFSDITERHRAQIHINHLNRLLSSVRNINQLIVKESNQEALLKQVCEILVEVSGYLFVWIGFINEDNKKVISVARWGFENGFLDDVTITWDNEVTSKGPTGTAIKTEKTCVFNDLMNNPNYAPWREEAEKRGYKSSIAVPIIYQDKIYGTLNVYADTVDYFYSDEIELLEEAAQDIAYALFVIDTEEKQKETQEYLRESEERYRELFENISSGVAVYEAVDDGEDFIFKDFNKAGERIDSLEKKDVIGKRLTERFPGIKEFGLFDVLQRVWKTGKPEFFPAAIYKDEREVGWRENWVYKLPSGEIVAVYDDVTDRKRAEQEIRESEEKWRGIFENSIEAVFEVDLKGNFTTINDALAEVMGYEREEIVGSNFKKYADPEEIEYIFDTYNQLYRTGVPVRDLVYKTIRKDGEARTLEVYINVIRKGDDITGFQGTLRDITDRIRAEEALQKSEAQLSNALRIAQAGHWEYDVASDTFTFNDNFYRIFGTTAEEVGGYQLSSADYATRFCHPDDVDLVSREVREAIETNDPSYSRQLEHRIVYADGEVGHIAVRFFIVKDAQGRTVKTYGINQDITERYRSEEELRKSEEKYRTILENIDDGYFEVDSEGNFAFFNESMCRILGYSKDEMLGLSYKKYMDKETANDVFEIFNEVYKTKKVARVLDRELITKDKRRLYVSTSISPMFDKDENVTGFRGIARDITDRKQAEAALMESERILNSTGQIAEIGGWEHDIVTGKAVWTKALYDIVEIPYDEEPPSANEHLDYYPSPDREILSQAYNKAIETGTPFDLELQVYTSKKKLIWCRIRGEPVYKDGKCVGLRGTSQNITKQKLVDDALKKSEESYRSLVENINDLIYNLDTNGNFTYVGPRINNLSKYSVEDLMGKPFQSFIHPDDFSSLLESFKNTLKGIIEPYEFRVVDKDGSVKFVRSSSRPIVKDGEVVGITGVITDITEKKKMEEQLIQAEKLSSLGGILSGVAHELNNPLTSIIGNAQILMRGDIPSHIKDKLEVIMKESIRSSKIVGGLLAFAREHKSEKKMIDINEIIYEAYRLREYELRVDDVLMNLNLSKDIPVTSADPYQLQQVFINIINNAYDALLENNGGTLDIFTFQKENSIIMEFKDNGTGIPKDHLKKVFDPFFTTKEVGKGTGLGMSIVYGIVTDHGGTIDVESEVGKGTKFTIQLPITEEITKKEEQYIKKIEKPEGDIRVLVVEDEESLRDFLVEALETEGYIAEMAKGGEEAIKFIEKRDYDIIITDMKMPGLTGQSIYNYVKKQDQALAERMIFITGDILGKETQNFFKITGAKFVEKPFQLNDLLSHMVELLVGIKDPR